MTQPTGLVQVLIPTTEGPVAVVDLAREADELDGGIALVHGSALLAGISPEYAGLLGHPELGLADRFGHRAWRLELSADIDTGRSWEAGIVLAHALQAADRLATLDREPIPTVVWITGSIEASDLGIGTVEHIDHKLQTSLSRLEQAVASGQRVLVVAPPTSWETADSTWRNTLATRGIESHACQDFDDFARLVGVSLPPRPKPVPARRVTIGHAIVAAAVLGAIFVGSHLLWRRAQHPPDPATILGRGCDVCPIMVSLPRDTSKVTDNSDSSNPLSSPLKRFAIGMYEVTVGEYEAFISATGHPVRESCNVPTTEGAFEWRWAPRSYRMPSYQTTARHPVTCVSHDEATAYAAWVAKQTGRDYRLPTEREWDYAARAGSAAHFSFGDDESELCAHGRFAHAGTPVGRLRKVPFECQGHNEHGPLPVGSLKPNRWHLFDMHGNVWEWIADCPRRPARDPVKLPSTAQDTNTAPPACLYGMIRGGGYVNRPPQLRSSSFDVEPRTDKGRSDAKGFRLALTVDD